MHSIDLLYVARFSSIIQHSDIISYVCSLITKTMSLVICQDLLMGFIAELWLTSWYVLHLLVSVINVASLTLIVLSYVANVLTSTFSVCVCVLILPSTQIVRIVWRAKNR